MTKVLFIVAWLVIGLVATGNVEPTADDEAEEIAFAENYEFLLDLISEYDHNGLGAIKKEQYGEFLFKVITQGSEQEKVPITEITALREAVDAFADQKETEDIGSQ